MVESAECVPGAAGSGQMSVRIDDLVIAARIFALTGLYAGQLSSEG